MKVSVIFLLNNKGELTMELKEILNEYKFKYDLHVHTSPVSVCGEIDAETTVSN